jgi:hypothetical protein
VSADPRLLAAPCFHPIAMFFWSSGRVEESVALVEWALRVDPGNLETQIMMADFLLQTRRLEDAVGHYRAINALRRADEVSGEEQGTQGFRREGSVRRPASLVRPSESSYLACWWWGELE